MTATALLDRPLSRRRFLSRSAALLGAPAVLAAWGALDAPLASAAGAGVTMIGDSLTYGSLPYQRAAFLAAGFSTAVVNGYGSRGIATKVTADPYTGLTAVPALRAANGDTPYWVVALGTNDSGIYASAKYADLIRRMMDAIGTGHHVMWVNVYLPTMPSRQANWNAALATVAAERDGEMVVHDWAAVAAQHRAWLTSDSVHYTATGYSRRSTAVAGAAWSMVPATASAANTATNVASAGTSVAAVAIASTTPTLTRIGTAAGFVPATPVRALDSRIGDLRWAAGEHRTVDLSSFAPAGAVAVALDVAVVEPAASSYLTLAAAGASATSAAPRVATVTGRAGRTIAGHAVVPLSDAGAVDVYAHAATDVVLDVYGWYVDGGAGLHPVTPTRVLDTRRLAEQPAAGETLTIALPSVDGVVPVAAVVNIAAADVADDGYVTAWPAGADRPQTAVLTTSTEDVATANLAQVALDGDGRLSIRSSTAAALVVDLLGLYADGEGGRRLQPVDPLRALDTRDGTGGWAGALASGQRIDVTAPLDEGAAPACILGTLTATRATSPGYLSVWSGDGDWPGTASANLSTSRIVSNAVLTTVAGDGMLALSQGGGGGEHLVLDVTAVFV